MKKPNFYQDKKGNLKQYYYCSDCGKQHKDKKELVDVGSDKLPIMYCKVLCYARKMGIPQLRQRDTAMAEVSHVSQIEDLTPCGPAKRGHGSSLIRSAKCLKW